MTSEFNSEILYNVTDICACKFNVFSENFSNNSIMVVQKDTIIWMDKNLNSITSKKGEVLSTVLW